ncbi:unnamed protein product [Symbiodinium sp. CCMP2592]|nr:unnamed protein product [Symbiodinium sp. CCMP2592]
MAHFRGSHGQGKGNFAVEVAIVKCHGLVSLQTTLGPDGPMRFLPRKVQIGNGLEFMCIPHITALSPVQLRLIRGYIGPVGTASVILDLTRVGGHYFANVLPRKLSLDRLNEYVVPLTSEQVAEVDLHDGDVIVASWYPDTPNGTISTEALFREPFQWAGEAIMCSFRISNLDVQGRKIEVVAGIFLCCVTFDHLGEDVHFAPNSTLLFFAEGIPSDDSEDSSSSADHDVQDEPVGHRVLPALPPEAEDVSILSVPPPAPATVAWNEWLRDPSFDERGFPIDGTFGVPSVVHHQTTWQEDSTLPSGHSWNALSSLAHDTGNEARGSSQGPPVSTPAPGEAATDGGTADTPMLPVAPENLAIAERARTPVLTLTYTPEYMPELIVLSFPIPCGIEQAVQALQECRSEGYRDRFPRLIPVQPQPCQDSAVFVAAPDWLQDRAIVLIDCRRIDGSVFAAVVPLTLSRESILVAAGFSHDVPHQVFVHGLIQPLAMQQHITLFSGLMLIITAHTAGAPAVYDIAEMLQDPMPWSLDVMIPGPEAHPGSHYYILTDGMPLLFKVQAGRRSAFRQDLIQALRSRATFLTVLPTAPQTADHYTQGVPTSGVLIATKDLLEDSDNDPPDDNINPISVHQVEILDSKLSLAAIFSALKDPLLPYFPDAVLVQHPDTDHVVICVACPAWPCTSSTVLFDLRTLDGRLFAQQIPRYADKFMLLQFAGLATGADVEVYCQAHHVALEDGREIRTYSGQRVCICPSGVPATYHFSPEEEYGTSHTVVDGAQDSHFCVVTDLAYSTFLLSPARSFLYRADLASRHGLRLEYLAITPAVPGIRDACVYGRLCQNVVAVGENDSEDGIASFPTPIGSLFTRYAIVFVKQHLLVLMLNLLGAHHIGIGSELSGPSTALPDDDGLRIGIGSLDVYTDGSYNGKIGSWAFVAIGHTAAGSFLFAWAKGTVADPDESLYPGAEGHSAVNGERTAIFWAACWLLGIDKSLPRTLHSDCLIAANQAEGHYGANTDVAFVKACRAIVQVHDALHKNNRLVIRHVKGHSGDPYNELADVLAGNELVENSTIPEFLWWYCSCARDQTLEWLWLTIAALPADGTLPVLLDGLLVDPGGQGASEARRLEPEAFFGTAFAAATNKSTDSTAFQLSVRIVSVNVQTLCEAPGAQPNRVPFVREQLELLGCSIIGLQETRAKTTSTVTSQSHIRFISACDGQGNLGVELWISRSIPIGWFGNRPIHCDTADFSVLHWSPRCLIVRLVKDSFRLVIIVCHAPTSGSAERDGWWKEFCAKAYSCARHDRVIILGDLNARICAPVHDRIGDIVWENEHVATSACSLATRDVVAKLRPLVGPPRRKQRGPAPLPAVLLEDGTHAATPDAADERWLRHFSSIEHGGPVIPEEHITHCLSRQDAVDTSDLEVVLAELPSRFELEDAMRRSQVGRAAGNDQLPAEVWKCQAPVLSAVLYPIMLKTALRLTEPLQMKGGTMHKIWKAKGPQQECASYRGILVSSNAGKCIHSAFRSKCGAWLETLASPLQIGGRRGFPVQLAAQAARSFQQAALRQGHSVALIFLDLREAFHRVARPLVHGGDLSDEHVAYVLKTFGIPPAGIEELHTYVREASLIREAGASPWASALLAEFQTDSWFSINGHLAAVQAGTRPGDSLADVVFSYLFSAVLRRVRQALLGAGLTVHLPWNPAWAGRLDKAAVATDQLAPIDVSWMDDLVLLLWSASADGLISDTKLAAEVLLDECVRALLHPNLDPGKSEAIVSLVGRGSRKLRAALFRNPQPGIELQPQVYPASKLRFVAKYKHLGGILHWQGSLSVELRARVAQAWQAFRKHRRAVFASPLITHREKALLFRSVVASTLYFGAGTWVYQEEAALQPLQGALLAMARQMLRPTYHREAPQHLGAGLILAVARLPNVCTELHAARLRHLSITLAKAPPEFWAILHYDCQWLLLVQDSLAWIRGQHSRAGNDISAFADWQALTTLTKEKPQVWKRLISQAVHYAQLQDTWSAEVGHYHGLLLRFLLAKGAHPANDLLVGQNASELCAVCGQVFSDLRKWSHHAFKCHGRVREERYFAEGQRCKICLRHFASNFRLCNHLKHSRACLAALATAGATCDPQPGKGSKRFYSGADQPCPAVTASGPVPRGCNPLYIPESQRASEEVLRKLEDIFAHPSLEGDFAQLLEAVRSAFQGQCLQVTRLRATATAWQEALHQELERCEEISVEWATWHHRIADFLTRVDFVAWLVPDPTAVQHGIATFRDAATILPWLITELLHIECSTADCCTGTWLCARNRPSGCSDDDKLEFVSHDSCFRDPSLIDITSWCQSAGPVRGFCLLGLLSSLVFPTSLRSYKQLFPHLLRLRLFADAVRGTLQLWTAGRPAFCVVQHFPCPGLEVVRKIAPVSIDCGGYQILANFPGAGEYPRRFTFF